MKKITLISILTFTLFVFAIFLLSALNTDRTAVAPRELKQKTQTRTHIKSPAIDLQSLVSRDPHNTNPNTITMSEVARHNTKKDCYLAVNGNAYDVSPYMPYHPAGSRIIGKYCGREVTKIFAKIHSNRAWNLLEKYKVGVISNHKVTPTPEILSAIQKALAEANPGAIVVRVAPSREGYIAKLLLDGVMYEVHMDASAKITKEEDDGAELNWDSWDTDKDDL